MSHPRIPDDVLNRLARAQRVSDGELKALKLALQQRRSKDIARKLGISEAATRKRLGEVYKKFGIKGRGPGKLASLQRHLIAQAVDPVPEAPVPVPSLSPQIEQHSEPVAPFRSSVALPDNPDLKTEYLWNDAPALSLFEGRREPLMHLKQWVLQPATAPKLLAICGLGGIGKTALAIQLVTELNGYFEQVIWLTARADQHPAALVSVLLEMLSASADDAAQLGANSSDDSSFYSGDYCSVKRTRGLIRQLLARLSQQRVLVIIDGFEQVFIKGNAEAEARAKTPTFEANRQQQASLYVEDLAGYGELIDAFQQPVSNGVMTGEMTGVSALLLTSREKPRELLALPAGSCCASLYSLGGLKVHEAARMLSLFELKGDATDYK
ncbi:MAG: NB-ARC domain-containing protein, partial [Cyanobacteria bacterium J06553_1]